MMINRGSDFQGEKVGGIILAGGKSQRMGSDKRQLQYKGMRLIDYPISILEPICEELLISANDDELRGLPYTIVADKAGTFGPLAGIHACLSQSRFEINIVLSCDMPMISKEVIEYMLANMGDAELVMPRHGRFFEPLCAIYKRSLLPSIDRLFEQNQYAPLQLIPMVDFKAIDLDEAMGFYHPGLFHNINTEEDLMP